MTRSNRRKLHRSNNDKALAGIFGGLGDYFDIDSNLLRLIGLLIFVFSGFVPFLIIYFVAMFIIPSDRESSKERNENEAEGKNYSSISVYKKWWFWLIIIIVLLPIIFTVLGFFLFSARGGFTMEEIEFRREGTIIKYPENRNDHIKIYPTD